MPLTSRQLLCLYVLAVWYGCAALCMEQSYYVYLFAVLLIALYLRFAGRKCNLLRGTYIVCTFVVCDGRAALVHRRVVLYVPVYCATQNVPHYVYRHTVLRRTYRIMCTGILATHCIVPGIRGCLRHLRRGTCSVCTFLPCATALRSCAWTCRTMRTDMLCCSLRSTWDSRECLPLISRHLLCMSVFALCYGCAALCMELSYDVYRYTVQPRTYRTLCTCILCYLFHSSWDSRVCVFHLL